MIIEKIGNYFIYDYKDDKLIIFNSNSLEFGLFSQNDMNLLVKQISNMKTNEKHYCGDNFNHLYKAVLLLTTKCNLQCRYCYADYGKYDRDDYIDVNMTFKNMDSIVDYLIQKYSRIKYLQFFGGEPFLYIEGIDYFIREYHKKKGDSQTKFGAVTNGTIINNRLDRLVNTYNLKITVSLDGDRVINDQLRIFKDGTGTYDMIIKFINHYRKNINMIESTYTKIHQDMGYSINDVKNMIYKLTGISNTYIVPVQTENEVYKTLETKLIESELENSILDTLDILSSKDSNRPIISANIDIVYHLLNKMRNSNFCPAGINQMAFFVDGKLYPCYRYCNNNSNGLRLNNLSDDKLTSWQYKFVRESNCKDNVKCNQCEYKYLCTTCIAINNVPMNDSICEKNKLLLERILKKIVDIYFSEKKDIFCQNLNKWLKSLGV